MKKIIRICLLTVLLALVLSMLLISVAFAADEIVKEVPVTPDFWAYIVQEALVLIPVLYIFGYILKRIPKFPDWVIPIALVVIGMPAAMGIIGWTIDGAIQGVLVVGTTVLGNQLYKQAFQKRQLE